MTAAWMTEDWKTTERLMVENGKAAGRPRTRKLLSDQGQERTAGDDQDGKTTGQTGGLLGMTRMENGPRMGRLLDNQRRQPLPGQPRTEKLLGDQERENTA